MVNTSSRSNLKFDWSVLTTEGPGPRSRHCLVYDRGNEASVLFGGLTWLRRDDAVYHQDTWELRDDEWTQMDVVSTPPARHRAAMVFDSVRGFSVLFGGQGNLGDLLGDTWIYDRQSWRTVRSWWSRPGPRVGHVMAFDESLGKTILFGGAGRSDQNLGDTWLFDGASWRRCSGPAPPPRRYAAFAYDPMREGCVLHGGSQDESGRLMFGDAWLFRDGAWQCLPDRFTTEPRDDHGLVFHRAAGRLLTLEGLRATHGCLTLAPEGWERCPLLTPFSRHQCSPLVWSDEHDGLLMHGGETHHGGDHLDETYLFRLAGPRPGLISTIPSRQPPLEWWTVRDGEQDLWVIFQDWFTTNRHR